MPDGKPAAYIPEFERRMFKIVDDPEAAGGKTLQVAVDKRIIRSDDIFIIRTPAIPRAEAPVGLYKVTVRMKISGMLNVIGTAIRLTSQDLPPTAATVGKAKPRNGARYDEPTIHNYMFKDADAYQEFSYLTEVIEPDHISLRPFRDSPKNSLSNYPGMPSKAQLERILAGTPPAPEDQKLIDDERTKATTKAETEFTAGDLHVNLNLLHTTTVGFGRSRNSIETISVDKIKIERVAAPASATVRQVLPQKIQVRPGENQLFHVWLHNRSGKPQTGDLHLKVTHGFDTTIEVAKKPVTIEPGKYAVIPVPWTTAKDVDLWGCTVTADFEQSGKSMSSAEDVFSVHRNPWAVMNFGGSNRSTNPYYEPPSYRNFQEFFGNSPGDGLKPFTDDPKVPFFSGIAGYPTSVDYQRLLVKHNHDIGVVSFMYIWPGSTSYPVEEAFEKHPGWFGGRLNWTDQASDLYVNGTVNLVKEWTAGKGVKSTPLYNLIAGGNDAVDVVFQNKLNSVIKAMKAIGYDGVRWDSDPFSLSEGHYAGQAFGLKAGENADAKGAELIRKFKEAVRKEFPNFTEAANTSMGNISSRAYNRKYDVPNIDDAIYHKEFLKDGSGIMDEGWMNAWLFTDSRNIIKDYFWGARRQVDAVRRMGGFLHMFSPARDDTGYFTQSIIYYNHLVTLAGAQYPGGVSCSPGSEMGLAHFITRYSEFLWDNKLMWLADAGKKIRIESPVELWWDETVVYRQLPDGKMRYVIPVVNPPTVERFLRDQFSELPEPIRDPLPVEVKIPEGYKTAKARMLTSEPTTSCKSLEASIEGGVVKFEIPELVIYRVIVVEFEK